MTGSAHSWVGDTDKHHSGPLFQPDISLYPFPQSVGLPVPHRIQIHTVLEPSPHLDARLHGRAACLGPAAGIAGSTTHAKHYQDFYFLMGNEYTTLSFSSPVSSGISTKTILHL